MGKYKYKPRLFIVNVDGVEVKLLTIDSCEPDDTIYYYSKGMNYSQATRNGIAMRVRYGEWRERLLDDVSNYDVDLTGFETMYDIYAEVIEGYKKAVEIST